LLDAADHCSDLPRIGRRRRKPVIAVARALRFANRAEHVVCARPPDPIARRALNWRPGQRGRRVGAVGHDHFGRHAGLPWQRRRPRAATRGQRVKHALDRGDLQPGLGDIAVVVIDVAPPVPAGVRIERQKRARPAGRAR